MAWKSSTLDNAWKWLQTGRDVTISGDHGSGRSTLLNSIGQRATAAGVHVLSMQGRQTRLAQLPVALFHDLVPDELLSTTTGMLKATALLHDELQGRKNLLIIDDIDLLDPLSLFAVEELLLSTNATLISSTCTVRPQPRVAFLERRGQARILVEPIAFEDAAVLLTTFFGEEADFTLISEFLTRTGGNPAAMRALVDSALFSDATESREARRQLVKPLETLPHESLTQIFCADLTNRHLHALETLAYTGALDVDDAESICGRKTIRELFEFGRVRAIDIQDRRHYVVAPQGLDFGLRKNLNEMSVSKIENRLESHFGNTYSPPQRSNVDASISHSLAEALFLVDLPDSIPSVTAGLVLDRHAIHRASALTMWRESPTVHNSVQALVSLGNSYTNELVRDIFESAVHVQQDSDNDIDMFWDLLRTWEHTKDLESSSYTPVTVSVPAPTGTSRYAEQSATLKRINTLCAQGHPIGALEAIDCVDDSSFIKVELDAARADALLYAGKVAESVAWTNQRLTEAVNDLDAYAIRTFTACLSGALFMAAYEEELSDSLTLALRLGLPGVFESSQSLRCVAFAAGKHARQGNTRVASLLLSEIEKRPFVDDLQVLALAAWAAAEIHFCEEDESDANQVLKEFGFAALENGNVTAAMSTLLSLTQPLTPQESSRVNAVYVPEELPLFERAHILHSATTTGPSQLIVDALGAISSQLPPTQSRSLLVRLNDLRISEGLNPVSVDQLAELTGGLNKLDPTAIGSSVEPEGLSEREKQIILLARTGLSNKEIASRLVLSRRTVENHLYRALRKLGFQSRADLATWEP